MTRQFVVKISLGFPPPPIHRTTFVCRGLSAMTLSSSGLCAERRRRASASSVEDQELDSCRSPSLGLIAKLFDLPFSCMGCVLVVCSRVCDRLRDHLQHASADGEPKLLVIRCSADWQNPNSGSHSPKSRAFVRDIE